MTFTDKVKELLCFGLAGSCFLGCTYGVATKNYGAASGAGIVACLFARQGFSYGSMTAEEAREILRRRFSKHFLVMEYFNKNKTIS
ncbi:MAG: hypothetical protein AABW88_04995 [Nanoarchaeota archaeon]